MAKSLLYRIQQDGACDSGALDCETLVHPLVPPWRDEYTRALIPTFSEVLTNIVKFRLFSPRLTVYSFTAGFSDVKPTFRYVTNEIQRVDHAAHLVDQPDFVEKWGSAKRRILIEIGEGVYRKVPQLLFVVGLLGLLVVGVYQIRKRLFDPVLLCGVLVLGGLCGHVTIITIINITSYDGAFRLGHTDYPMVLMFCILMVLAIKNGFGAFREKRS